MNCFYHPELSAVAQCGKCNKGICRSCVAYQKPILCKECLQKIDSQIKSKMEMEKKAVLKRLRISGILFVLGIVYSIGVFLTGKVPLEGIPFIAVLAVIPIMGYVIAGVPYGWRALSKPSKGNGTIYIYTTDQWYSVKFLELALKLMLSPCIGWIFLTKELFSYYGISEKIRKNKSRK